MNLLGVEIDDVPQAALVTSIINLIRSGDRGIFVYINIHAINLALDLPWFLDFLNHSYCAYCDGAGVLLGAQLAGSKLTNRSSPPDWIASLATECETRSIKWFLLGGHPGVSERAAAFLTHQFPELLIIGTHHGYFDTTPDGEDNAMLIDKINDASPDILLIGMGMPLQEKWLNENWHKLNVKVALPVGALLDYLAGSKRRPPQWMARHGLEWAGRLISEPGRLWKRYLIGIPRFFFSVLWLRLGNGQ